MTHCTMKVLMRASEGSLSASLLPKTSLHDPMACTLSADAQPVVRTYAVDQLKPQTQQHLQAFLDLDFSVYGGDNAPYVWVGFPGKPSWDVFAEILDKCDVVTTPGSGFGPAGEGFVRASAFAHR